MSENEHFIKSSPNSPAVNATPQQTQLNFISRLIEISRFSGAPAQAAFCETAFSDDLTSEVVTENVQISNVVGNGAGLLFGIFIYYVLPRRYRKVGVSTNPFYRNFKTLAYFGWQLGVVISNFLGIKDPNKRKLISIIVSDIGCIVFGLFAIPYWIIREKILKIPANSKPKYSIVGFEGWSKYAKTFIVFGTAVGQAIGGLISSFSKNISSAATSINITFYGGLIGVSSFAASLLMIPLINWVSSKFRKNGKSILQFESKKYFSNSYIRTGLTIGAGIGACLGLLIGNWTTLGLILGGTIVSAIGSVIGGVLLSIYGYKLHKKLHPLQKGKTEKDNDIDNSWDYTSRSTASVFGFIGAAVVCAINPAAALLLVPIGTAIASLIGWCLGVLIMKYARQLPGNAEEKKAATLPWTQRITTGANIGSIIGGIIGIGVGFAGFLLTGPAGVILAISLFGAIGAIIGGISGALYDKESRQLIWQAIKKIFCRTADDPFDAPLSHNSSRLGSTAKTLTALPTISKKISAMPISETNATYCSPYLASKPSSTPIELSKIASYSPSFSQTR